MFENEQKLQRQEVLGFDDIVLLNIHFLALCFFYFFICLTLYIMLCSGQSEFTLDKLIFGILLISKQTWVRMVQYFYNTLQNVWILFGKRHCYQPGSPASESFLFHITSEVHSNVKSRIVASKLRGCPSKSKIFPSHKFSHLFHPSYSRQDFKLSNDFLRHSQAWILLVKKDGFTRVDEKLICSVAEGGPGMAGRAGRRWEGGDRLWSRGKVNIGIKVTIVIIIINNTIGHTPFPYKTSFSSPERWVRPPWREWTSGWRWWQNTWHRLVVMKIMMEMAIIMMTIAMKLKT